MSDSTSDNEIACDLVRELIAWYPGGTLDEGERACVEEHVAGCPACADLLRFTSDFKDRLREEYSHHPDAEALVCFVEDKSSMNPTEVSFIEQHLGICQECREQASMLETVDRSIAEEETAESSVSRVPGEKAGPISPMHTLWDTLKTGLLRPVPAAIYLVVALVAIGLLVRQPVGWIDRGAERERSRIGVDSGTGSVPGALGGIVILPDETDRVRQTGQDEFVAPRIDAGAAQFLLLELTGLEAPPAEEALYSVVLLREGAGEPAFRTTVRGNVFSENYTLCLSLPAEALTPGHYVVEVTGPGGVTVFRSSIDAR